MPEHTPAPTPARSLYGFFLYLMSKTLLCVYCAWVFIPDQYLHYINIYYYPQKYWATAVPIQCLLALALTTFFIIPSINCINCPNIDSNKTLTDSYSLSQVDNPHIMDHAVPDYCICKNQSMCHRQLHVTLPDDIVENTVQPLHDLDIRSVCKNLYLNKTS